MASDRIKLKANGFALGDVRVNGEIGGLMERFFHHRVNSREARCKVYQEAIDAFRNRVDDAAGVYGIWQGEFWGKWVISACRVARYTDNAELVSFLRSAAYELLSLRDPDGCISTYRNTSFFTVADPEAAIPLLGSPCDWNWNIWCRKYTLWGLLEVFELTGEAPILEACRRLAEQLIDSLERSGVDIHQTGTFSGLPSCSILKPIVILYRHTGEERFKAFADFIVEGWNRADGRTPNLIANALSGKPIHEWYGTDYHHTKVYELLSCFDGLMDYYRLTGDETCLRASEAIVDGLLEHEANRVGTVGYNDEFRHAAIYLNSGSEPCDAIHWMRLCFELFKATGNARYMDTFEKTALNTFLAAIFHDGTWGMRVVRSSGFSMVAPEQAKCHYNHCCVNNMPRGLVNLAESCVMEMDGALAVNQYIPFHAAVRTSAGTQVTLDMAGSYLADGKTELRMVADAPTDVLLRIPAWSRTAQITVNGKTQTVAPGYQRVALPGGESRIAMEFEWLPKLELFPFAGEPDAMDSWHVHKLQEGPLDNRQPALVCGKRALFTVGPLLLAKSKRMGSSSDEVFEYPVSDGKATLKSLVPMQAPEVYAGFMATFVRPDGTERQMPVCGFASAGNLGTRDPRFFNMFF